MTNNKKYPVCVLLPENLKRLIENQSRVTGFSQAAILRKAFTDTKTDRELETGKYERKR